jgi:adenylylsulfate kinase
MFKSNILNELDQDRNLTWHRSLVSREMRENQNGHRSLVLWFTGLSGAGKSTLAHRVEHLLYERGCKTYVFDGDNVRHGLCRDLGFSPEDRQENIRRISEMCKLVVEAGVIAMTAFISPYQKDRDLARQLFKDRDFIEVFCDTPLNVCETRDVKGLYRRARKGEIPEFTGISSPYETPDNPEITARTGDSTLDECAAQIIQYLEAHHYL